MGHIGDDVEEIEVVPLPEPSRHEPTPAPVVEPDREPVPA